MAGFYTETRENWWKTRASSACTEVTGNCHFPGYRSKKKMKHMNYIHKSPSLQPPWRCISSPWKYSYKSPDLCMKETSWTLLRCIPSISGERQPFWKPPSLGAKASCQIQVINHPRHSEVTALTVQVWKRKPASSRGWKVPPLLIEVWFSSGDWSNRKNLLFTEKRITYPLFTSHWELRCHNSACLHKEKKR